LKTTLIVLSIALAGYAGASDAVVYTGAHLSLQSPEETGVDAISIPRLLSYQGKLTDNSGNPVADTTYSVSFRFYTVASGGTAFWNETQTVRTRAGLFSVLLGSVTPIGSMPDAGAVYLGMAVAGGAELTPRLRIASSAYAYLSERAANADLLQGRDTVHFDSRYVNENQVNSVTSAMIVNGTVAAADLNQMGAASGQVLKWTGSAWTPRNDSVGGGGPGDNAWVRGTPDSVLFTVSRLGIARGASENALHGSFRQSHVNLGVSCTTGVSGQDYSNVTVSGGVANRARAGYATVGGGLGNLAGGSGSVVAGGVGNRASGDYSVVAGGYGDTVLALCGAVLSGFQNVAGSAVFDTCATVCGGSANRASGRYATVGGGSGNATSRPYGTVAGGHGNVADGAWSYVGGGEGNEASGTHAVVSGGESNMADTSRASVGGGYRNSAAHRGARVGGGEDNVAEGLWAAVAGGLANRASGNSSFVGSGQFNLASGGAATIPGGLRDTAAADNSFATNLRSVVTSSYDNSAAFNGQRATASNQLRCGTISKAGGSFTIDHPDDPHGKVLNHYFAEGPEMLNFYRGTVLLDASGRAEARLPDYFSSLNREPMVQLTGVGTPDVYVAEDVSGNRFVVGGPPGTRVYWQVTGERKDVSAEVIRRMMPVEQPKTADLAGVMLDDDFLAGCMEQLVREGRSTGIDFRTAAGRQRYEGMKLMTEEAAR
jgi:hypothetical protein